MILFIGGVSCTGKTLLARELLIRTSVPFFSVDHLMMGLYRSQSISGLHPDQSPEDLAETLWPIVRSMAETNIENKHSMIFEGVQLLPQDVHRFRLIYPDDCDSVFLGFADQYWERESENAIRRNRNAVEQREYQASALKLRIQENERLKMECKKYGVAYYETRSDFERERTDIVQQLANLLLS